MSQTPGPTPGQQRHEDYLRCRAIGHALYDIEAGKAPEFGVLWLYRCERCGTERHDITDRAGNLLARWYDYPPGYSTTGDERQSRAQYRAELLGKRMTPRALRAVR